MFLQLELRRIAEVRFFELDPLEELTGLDRFPVHDDVAVGLDHIDTSDLLDQQVGFRLGFQEATSHVVITAHILERIILFVFAEGFQYFTEVGAGLGHVAGVDFVVDLTGVEAHFDAKPFHLNAQELPDQESLGQGDIETILIAMYVGVLVEIFRRKGEDLFGNSLSEFRGKFGVILLRNF